MKESFAEGNSSYEKKIVRRLLKLRTSYPQRVVKGATVRINNQSLLHVIWLDIIKGRPATFRGVASDNCKFIKLAPQQRAHSSSHQLLNDSVSYNKSAYCLCYTTRWSLTEHGRYGENSCLRASATLSSERVPRLRVICPRTTRTISLPYWGYVSINVKNDARQSYPCRVNWRHLHS